MMTFLLHQEFLILILLISSVAYANINIHNHPPSPSFDYMYTEDGKITKQLDQELGPGSIFYNIHYNYIDDPLENQNKQAIVESLHSLEFRTTYILNPSSLIGARLSLNRIRTGGETHSDLGDTLIQYKKYLFGDKKKYDLSVLGEIFLPTGNEAHYLSTGKAGASFKFVFNSTIEKWLYSLNLGYRYQPGAIYKGLNYENHIVLAGGLKIPFGDKFFINTEMAGFISVPFRSQDSPGEYYAGVGWKATKSSVFSAGVSTSGLENENENNHSLRIIGGVKFFEAKNKKVIECKEQTFSRTYFSRKLTKKEQASIKTLPYKSNRVVKTKRIKTIQMGDMTGLTKNGLPYVIDSQVILAIDLENLPLIDQIKEINFASFKFTVNKISQDKFIGTEIFCLINQKICSGEFISSFDWRGVVEKKYLKDGKAHNNLFSKQYLEKSVGLVDGKKIYSSEMTFKLDQVLKGSKYKAKSILFGKESRKTLYIVIADDTFIKNDARLELTYTTEGKCI